MRGADWPRYRGTGFDGISTEKNWLGDWPGGQPKQLWKKNVGIGFASMTVADGHLFTVGHDGQKKGKESVYCLDAISGVELWKFAYDEELDPKYYDGGPSATPTVDGGRVYAVSKHGLVYCLNAADGKELWHRNVATELGMEIPTWGFAGSAHVEGKRVILNVGDAGLALDKDTGKEVWQSAKTPGGYSTPFPAQIDGHRVIVLFSANDVMAVDPASGKQLWRSPWKTEYEVNAADPIVSGNRVYISSGYGSGNALLEIKDGKAKQVWMNKEIRAHFVTPIAIGNYIYGIDGSAGDNDSRLKCLDMATGKVLWSSSTASTGSLAAADGKLIWITGKGELIIAEATPTAYKEITRAQVTGGKIWTAPVLSNGKIYVRNAKGDVVCVDVKGASAG
jgi:outer membrane protein assembly factor BamB